MGWYQKLSSKKCKTRDVKKSDLVFFYHSNVKASNGMYDIIEVFKEAYDDPKVFDRDSPFFNNIIN